MYAVLVEAQIGDSHRRGEFGVLPRPATDAWEAAPPSAATVEIISMVAQPHSASALVRTVVRLDQSSSFS
jgi:hypothetical protein